MNPFQNEILGLMTVQGHRFDQRQPASESVAESQADSLIRWLSVLLTAVLNALTH